MCVQELCRVVESVVGFVLRDSSLAPRLLPIRAREVDVVAIFAHSNELDTVVHHLDGSFLADGEF